MWATEARRALRGHPFVLFEEADARFARAVPGLRRRTTAAVPVDDPAAALEAYLGDDGPRTPLAFVDWLGGVLCDAAVAGEATACARVLHALPRLRLGTWCVPTPGRLRLAFAVAVCRLRGAGGHADTPAWERLLALLHAVTGAACAVAPAPPCVVGLSAYMGAVRGVYAHVNARFTTLNLAPVWALRQRGLTDDDLLALVMAFLVAA